MMKLPAKRSGGFTLIELMIVVAIIGILAAIAIPNFLRFQLRSRSTEGRINIAAIRTAEEAFTAEFNQYQEAVLSPASLPLDTKVAFSDEGDAGSNFDTIGWRPEGQVYFQYGVSTGCSGQCYFIGANADIDNNGDIQNWGYHAPQFTFDVNGNVTGSSAAPDPPIDSCTAGDLMNNVTGACDIQDGNSVF